MGANSKAKKAASILIIVLLISCIAAISFLGIFNAPHADDYSYSSNTSKVWGETHSVYEVFKTAVDNSKTTYNNWQGTFFATFLFWFSPLSFGFENYALVAFFISSFFSIAFVSVIFDLLKFVEVKNKYNRIAVAAMLTVLALQTSTSASEAFYWYNSAIFYTFFFSLLCFLIVTIINWYRANKKIFKIFNYILAILLSMFIGGGNYPVAILSIALILMTFIYIAFKHNYKMYNLLIPCFILIIINLIISAAAPGNTVRQSAQILSPANPFIAIFNALVYSVRTSIKMFDFRILLIILSTIFFMFDDIKKNSFSFKVPILVYIISLLPVGAVFTPTFYALNNAGPLRVYNLGEFTVYLMFLLDIIYTIGWITHKKQQKCTMKVNKVLNKIYNFNSIQFFSSILVIFLLLCLSRGLLYPNSLRAVHYINSGSAQEYLSQQKERNDFIKSFKGEDVKVPKIETDIDLFMGEGLSTDTNFWVNKSMAKYYEVKSLALE